MAWLSCCAVATVPPGPNMSATPCPHCREVATQLTVKHVGEGILRTRASVLLLFGDRSYTNSCRLLAETHAAIDVYAHARTDLRFRSLELDRALLSATIGDFRSLDVLDGTCLPRVSCRRAATW